MKISYKKLWKLLIDRNMTKTQLRIAAGISSSSLAKLGKDENVTTSVLLKVQIPLERHAHSANGGMRIPDYSA